MKKVLITILVFALLITSLIFAASAQITGDTASTGESDTNIRIGEELFPVTVGETYTYEYYLNIGKRLTAIDAVLTYDLAGLELVSYSFPVLGSNNVYSGTFNNELHFNYLSTGGIAFESRRVLISAKFKVKKSGTYDVALNILDMCRYQEVKIVENGTDLTDYYSHGTITDSDDNFSSIYVGLGSYYYPEKYYKVQRNKTYTYNCYLKTDTKVGILKARTSIDYPLVNYGTPTLFSTNINTTSGKAFDTDDSLLVTVTFTVASDVTNGVWNIGTSISEILDINEDEIINYTKREEIEGLDYVTIHPFYGPPTDAPTAAPTAPAPTGAPTVAPAPTAAPTAPAPTNAPTAAPTEVPTLIPTEAPTQPPTHAPTQPYNYDLIGDVDNDGEVTSLDITYIQRWLADYTIPYPVGQKRT